MSEKEYVDAGTLLEDSFRLGMQVFESDFRPNFIVGVWRGGSPVGIAVQEILDFCGVETDHIAIRTSSYTRANERGKQVRVHGLNYIVKNVNAEDSLLIVDDVWDSGLSIQAILNHLQEETRRNMPENIKIATVYFKPDKNKTDMRPDFFIHETDRWLVFPHELHGLTADEITEKRNISSVLDRLRRHGRHRT